MKNNSSNSLAIIAISVLTVALIVLYILHFTSSNKASSAKSNTECCTAAPSGSAVYIQMDSLTSKYDLFNDLKSELEVKIQTIQDDLSKKGLALQRDAKNFEEKMTKGLLTRAQAETQQMDLMQRQQTLQKYTQQKQMEMGEEEAVMLRRVLDAIKTYLEKYNVEKKYSLILTTSGASNNVIVGDLSLDITNDVVAGLNAEYLKTKSNK